MKKNVLIGAAALLFSATSVSASTFTETSLTSKGAVIPGVTAVGGIVVDLVGTNGARVMSQLSASSLFSGNVSGVTNVDIGSQVGWGTSVTDALGGGIAEASFRLSLYDGDNASGNFDEDDNNLLINGIDFGNWSDVEAQNTTALGVEAAGGLSGGGFRNNLLDTGWFFSNDAGTLSTLFNSLLALETLSFELEKLDDSFQFYDFSQGIDGSLIDVGSGPVVTPPNAVPLPAAVWLFGPALLGLMGFRKKAKSA